jgi:hypothetical protein
LQLLQRVTDPHHPLYKCTDFLALSQQQQNAYREKLIAVKHQVNLVEVRKMGVMTVKVVKVRRSKTLEVDSGWSLPTAAILALVLMAWHAPMWGLV